MFIKTTREILDRFYKNISVVQDKKGKYWTKTSLGNKEYLLNELRIKK